MFLTVILFILILSLLVFCHELGHFVSAKKFGMKVDEFGFGFPPRFLGISRGHKEERKILEKTEEILIEKDEINPLEDKETVIDIIKEKEEIYSKPSWKFVWGDKEVCQEQTIYSINWIPIGGFVKIHGESGGPKDDQKSFSNRPVWQRFIVLVSGVFMNFVFAAVLLSIGFLVGLPSVVDDGLSSAARQSSEKIQVLSVAANSPAERAGISSGDEIVSIDDKFFNSEEAARSYIKSRSGEEVGFLLKRGPDFLKVSATAEILPTYNEKAIGVGLIKTALVSYPWYLAIIKGVEETVIFTGEVFLAFGNLLWNLIIHQSLTVDLAGPVGIAVMTGQAAALGIVYLLQFAAILSINLAVVNILPFPALDGGRLLFLLIEKIRRRSVSEKLETLVHNLGFFFLISLVVLVTFRDLAKFGGQIIGTIKNLIGV